MASSVEQKEKELSELEAEIANKKRDLNRITTSINAHALETEAAVAAKQLALADAQKAVADLAEAKSAAATAQEEIISLKEQIEEEKVNFEIAKKKKEELQNSADLLLSEIKSLTNQRDQGLAEISESLLAKKSELESELVLVVETIKEKTLLVAEYADNIKSLSAAQKNKEIELDFVNTQLTQADKERQSLSAELQDLSQKVAAKAKTLNEVAHLITEHKETLSRFIETEKKLQKTNEELESKIKVLQAEADALIKAKINFANERDALAQREASIKSIYEKAGVPYPL